MERTERKEDGNYCFTMTIKAIPEPTEIRWSLKENKEKAFELLNIHDDDYKGTTDAFPHPVLVVKFSKFEQYKFQIEVKNFTGNSSFIIQGRLKLIFLFTTFYIQNISKCSTNQSKHRNGHLKKLKINIINFLSCFKSLMYKVCTYDTDVVEQFSR